MDRRTARETAFLMLFEREFKKDEAGGQSQDRPGESAGDMLAFERDYRGIEEDEFTDRLYYGVIDKTEEIDQIIRNHSVGWKTKRMSNVSITIMRMALYEMMFMEDIPYIVSINEAVELAKKYEDEKMPGFINGILNAASEGLGLKEKQ